jgi:4'-phosphopantetheinyl transferase EntD
LEELFQELKDLPVHVKIFNSESAVPIKRVTKVSTVADIFVAKQSTKVCLPTVHRFLLYYSLALSSATAERTFSTMRRIRSWLRTSMSANSLNNCMFANIHKERMDNIDLYEVARDFICNDSRINYFGQPHRAICSL